VIFLSFGILLLKQDRTLLLKEQYLRTNIEVQKDERVIEYLKNNGIQLGLEHPTLITLTDYSEKIEIVALAVQGLMTY
jgi:hypothetical protein